MMTASDDKGPPEDRPEPLIPVVRQLSTESKHSKFEPSAYDKTLRPGAPPFIQTGGKKDFPFSRTMSLPFQFKGSLDAQIGQWQHGILQVDEPARLDIVDVGDYAYIPCFTTPNVYTITSGSGD
ncbi:MAG: hypothetical protein JXM79_00880 [Sedimentisphaerales bacterium]|nr:hypothetical protein [Sedimentisphaerales bacterium]